ncbi:Carbamoyl-phosphate synthase large chain [Apilactobacillus kunkeei]|uniref:carbamoyl phosphate synthase preATP-grasp domain-containing protein n=1 Tax=Apilactobacillus TaxID=2767877 RepID=UPI0020182C64|nr:MULTISPECIES: ATP-grasp domain-containing protein [Apilactobacillus]UZX33821.1 ATP-grasp domain-containing protein [Apilactobacillus kunkeei]CAI2594225.1 Carbamoyl-phosphate synthase large chain [Apilactobacillus kunkeei]CAI2594351.1 Carbamoyl-phosphate synthase large chain [Apilactobacillus kunkeei]CAI2594525.1 Carbamoyl-phosphate synthase large chain [Apilactobacillus kunkeei]CAI2594815.1 Carbamoyl-phosphate synthase large chain [Apilactobacillus kunkeei]
MIDNKIKKVLILGGGPSKIGSETELDAAAFQMMTALKKNGVQVLVIDNNPFSLTLSEVQPANVFIKEINLKNVLDVIKKESPDAIIPIAGGLRAIHVTQELLNQGILSDLGVRVLGISKESLKVINNPDKMKIAINSIDEPAVPSKIVRSDSEAFEVVREIGFPVNIKKVNHKESTERIICNNAEELSDMLEEEFEDDSVCIIEKSIVGYKQIETVAVRDQTNTKILISGLENIDAVGVHSGDSIVISPVQTLGDIEYQSLRTATFKMMDLLNIVGLCHIQFALDPNDGSNYYITKINPMINSSSALAARSTGYPLVYVCTNLLLGNSLPEIQLHANYHRLTPIMEPTLDHVVIKMPVWPFDNVPEANQHLNTTMKSVGSTIGVGRTVEEAMLKALRSSQFSPRDVLPSMYEISSDELISQLIHPKSDRLLVLIEALRRGYQVDELEELTKINQFYFYKLKELLDVEELIIKEPMKLSTIEVAHDHGFGDGMMAETWHQPIEKVRELYHAAGEYPTYKAIEPSAGEFDQNIRSFYSSYEIENESSQESEKTALVIGRGGNKLGPNTAADYYTAEMLIQLHRIGYKTIVMNNNPNALSLSPQISDKQYIEPIQLGAILNIIELEKPVRVFIPGNRHFLLKQLKKYTDLNVQVLPPDQETGVVLPKDVTYALNFFVTQDESYFISTEKLISNNKSDLDYVTAYETPYVLDNEALQRDIEESKSHIQSSNWIGLVQILFNQNKKGESEYVGIRPLRLTETIFLSRATGINWVRALVRFYTKRLDINELMKNMPDMSNRVTHMQATFPFKQLNVKVDHANSSQEVGAKIKFRLVDDK